MRILITTWSSRQAGGAETYVGRVMAQLHASGHQIGFCFETDEPRERQAIALPAGTVSFHIGAGVEAALAAIREWRPDVNYAHGLLDPDVEERLLDVAPGVCFAHSYYGTCISGDKTHKFPVVQPCSRRFGAACLALYFPRRCGGLSPIAMARSYSRQRHRLALLHRYAAVVTHSEHMRREFLRHGVAGGRVYNLSQPATPTAAPAPAASSIRPRRTSGPWHLVCVGRMDPLKGGRVLLNALPRVAAECDRPLRLTFAGDGPARAEWEAHARAVMAAAPGVAVEFAGWLPRDALGARLDDADVVIVPSLWPEPFGLVGPEANRHGVPVVAFATGGIPEWLEEGVNGCLAPADPPTDAGLAKALLRCLSSLASGDALREGALRLAQGRQDEIHIDALESLFHRVASPDGRRTA
jgi:glycosyltransferase involved in cell wall biosynthesis